MVSSTMADRYGLEDVSVLYEQDGCSFLCGAVGSCASQGNRRYVVDSNSSAWKYISEKQVGSLPCRHHKTNWYGEED